MERFPAAAVDKSKSDRLLDDLKVRGEQGARSIDQHQFNADRGPLGPYDRGTASASEAVVDGGAMQ